MEYLTPCARLGCTKTFDTAKSSHLKKYCCDSCRILHWNNNRGMRAIPPKICVTCGNEFTPSKYRLDQIFCSKPCKYKNNERLKKCRDSYKADVENQRLRGLIYRLTHPVNRESRRTVENRRRAKKVSPDGAHNLTTQEWLGILVQFNKRCAYCGSDRDITQDHVVPLTRGGSHTASNIVPACRPCNLSKNNKTAEEFRAYR